jgi:hypothetical protein
MSAMTRILCAALLFAATAQAADNSSREASRHFQRGVELYNDGDFRGALVEFKKANEVWPRANVLYDIGQTQYQLLDYAGALSTMNRYLAETGPNAAHRAEVEATVETLRGRVGSVLVTTEVSGCEVTVDGEPAGTTPVQHAIQVSVGLRKITASCHGRPSVTRSVEVSAGERLDVELRIPAPLVARVAAPATRGPDGPPSKAGLIASWTTTSLLIAGTVAVGASTLAQQSRLESMKGSYPIERSTLDKQASLVGGLSIASDVIGACALVAAGVSTWVTVKYRKESNKRRVAWIPGGITF